MTPRLPSGLRELVPENDEMAMTATELLDALAHTGTPDGTIALGRKFIRLMGEDVDGMLEHFKQARITEGTLIKARDLLSGRKKPADYEQPPPVWSTDAKEERLARTLGEAAARVHEEFATRQSEKQAEAQGGSVGAPHKHKEALVGAGKK